MKLIKKVLALVLLTSALSSAAAVGSDVVVLMDASGTILPYFDEINNRILVDITRKFVRQGDVFHLVSFNSRVNLEIVQPIQTEADVSRVVSRFMLLYPLGQNSDFLSGLQYTYQYVSSLEQQREKIIIVISDGIFNPPKSSPYAAFTGEQIKAEIASVSHRIRGAGWNVYYIKLPFPINAEIRTLDGNLVSTDKGTQKAADSKGTGETKKYTDISSEFTSALDIDQSKLPETDVPITFIDSVFSMPEVTFPSDLGRRGRFFTLPLKVRNNADESANLELTGVFLDDLNILGKNSFLNLSPRSRGTLKAQLHLPETVKTGAQDLSIRLQFSDNVRVIPQSAKVHIVVTNFSPELIFRSGGPIVLTLILIALAIILVAVLFMFIFHRTARPASDALRAAQKDQKANPEAAAAAERAAVLAEANEAASSSYKTGLQAGQASRTTVKTIQGAARADKQIDFQKEEKKYPAFAEIAKDTSSDKNITELAAVQANDKAERLAILTAAAKKPQHHGALVSGARANDHIEIKTNTKMMLEMQVSNQNPKIGKRNIHMMRAGSRLSIGGGSSSFLIFLVKFPAHIAEVRFDGEKCTLAILKPDYFPYETDNIITDCIDREIKIVSDKEYELSFKIRLYEDPVQKLNRLLTSILY